MSDIRQEAGINGEKAADHQGERTRMEIVYAPKEKLPLATLVQHPPQFNSKYLCAVLTDSSQFTTKVELFVQEISARNDAKFTLSTSLEHRWLIVLGRKSVSLANSR